MEYRNLEYQVVQISSPTGWKWTVQVPGRRILMSETNTIALSPLSNDGPSSVEGT
ncbi:hypothetical protein GGD63_006561 [Bradyrhizobium sp. cir1]|nr:hypothetical protein [Bradyrhizobium sp. cir1]